MKLDRTDKRALFVVCCYAGLFFVAAIVGGILTGDWTAFVAVLVVCFLVSTVLGLFWLSDKVIK